MNCFLNNKYAKKANYLLLLTGFVLLLFGGNSFAGSLKLAWDASKSRGVGGYKIYYGLSKKNYSVSIDVGKKLIYRVKGLTNGRRYFFTVSAYNKSRNQESKFSNEVRKTVPGVTVDFTPSITSGTAPLIVTFTPITFGLIKSWEWRFRGTSIAASKSKIPTVTFLKPGVYSVSLKGTGSGGRSVTKSKQITVYPPAQVFATAKAKGFGAVKTKESVNDPTQAMVAAFNFDESRGNLVKDSSGMGNHGSIKEAVRVKTGRYGNALKFDGVNDWVTVEDNESLDLVSGFSLEAWVKPISLQRSVVIVKQQQEGTVYDLYAYEDRDLPLSSFNDGFEYKPISGQESLPIKKWTHLAATFDGTYQRLYINGVQVSQSQTQNGLIKQSKGALRIGGGSAWGDFFQGYIDEVRIYNHAISAGEIQRDLRTPINSP